MKKIAMSLLLGVILVLLGNSQPRGAVADTKSLIADGMAAGSLKPHLETLPDYIPYQEIPQIYTQREAHDDGCVVVESRAKASLFAYDEPGILAKSRVVSGEEHWKNFLLASSAGKEAKLRLSFYFSSEEGEEALIGEGCLVYDLSHVDGTYFLTGLEDGEIVTKEYAGLKCFEGDYYEKEWFLLGEYFLEADYKTVLDGEASGYAMRHYGDFLHGQPSWQVIYFEQEEDAPRLAGDGVELFPDMEFEGVFGNGYGMVELLLKQRGNNLKLFVDGEEKLSLPAGFEFKFCDILKEDSYLELLVGEPVMISPDGEEEKKYYHVTAYRLKNGGLSEVALLPSGNDNTFYIDDFQWGNWSVGGTLYCYIKSPETGEWKYMEYQMMPEGYLAECRDSICVIYVDGEVFELPGKQVEIDGHTGVGIAFLGTGAMASKSSYDIYRSDDRGLSWSLVKKNFVTANAGVEHIYILDPDTVICCFELSGVAPVKEVYVTEDGGTSWENIEESKNLGKYGFLSEN